MLLWRSDVVCFALCSIFVALALGCDANMQRGVDADMQPRDANMQRVVLRDFGRAPLFDLSGTVQASSTQALSSGGIDCTIELANPLGYDVRVVNPLDFMEIKVTRDGRPVRLPYGGVPRGILHTRAPVPRAFRVVEMSQVDGEQDEQKIDADSEHVAIPAGGRLRMRLQIINQETVQDPGSGKVTTTPLKRGAYSLVFVVRLCSRMGDNAMRGLENLPIDVFFTQ